MEKSINVISYRIADRTLISIRHFQNMGKLLKARKLSGIVLLLLFVFSLHHFKILQPLGRIVYDSQIRLADREPLDDIVIVGIDKSSLDEIGRWPWSRDVHADFLNKISQVNPKAVVLDILFSEPGSKQNDKLLADAIANNSRVVLPVALESSKKELGFVENLPIELLQNSVAGIGHAQRVLDLDAVSRRSYLYAGLSGSLQWPSIALETIWVAGENPRQKIEDNLHPVSSEAGKTNSSWTLSEDYLLSFAGKAGTFKQISYSSVLSEDFDLKQLSGKYVLVGTTAIGLGDVVSTPVSGESNPMPGIEVIANELDSLLQGLMITELGYWPGLIITFSVVLISFLLWNFIPPRYSLFCAAGLIMLVLISDTWVLHKFRLWFAPANLIVGIGIGYLGWVWGRLVETVKYLNSELNRLGNVSMPLLKVNPQDGNKAFSYLMKINGFHQGFIKDHEGKILFQWDADQFEEHTEEQITPQLTTIEIPVERHNHNWQLNLVVDEKKIHKADAKHIAKQLTAYYKTEPDHHGITPVEFINSRIELVKAAYSKMHAMNDFVSEVIDQLYNGVVVTDTFGNVVMANRSSDKLLAYDRKQLDSLNVLDILKELKFSKEIDWFDVFANTMFKADEFVVEARNDSGQYLLVEVTRYAIDDQSTSGMVFNFIDVTALKETEQSRRELLAFLSHDLRSPLASLIATSDLAKIRPEYRESDNFIKSIKDNAKRALQLADDFLALMRAESISKESFQPVNFNAIVSESIAAVEGSAKAKKINIEQTLNPIDQLYVNGDESVLERVLINLLSNAIKYSPVDRKIEVGIKANAEELYCFVKDNGYGIKEEDKEKVFQRFERINHEGNADNAGTGLGLAFVKSSVERHNGRIQLESEPGIGSCFHIYLPLLTKKSKSQVAA